MNRSPQPSNRTLWLITGVGVAACIILGLMQGNAPASSGNAPWLLFLGRFHPVILHLPIGIMALIALQEAVALLRGNQTVPQFGSLALPAAAASATAAAVTGTLLFRNDADFSSNQLLQRHQLGGIFFAILSILLLICHLWTQRNGWKRHAFRFLLVLSLMVMILASHDGASITHGSQYLTQYAPGWLQFREKPASANNNRFSKAQSPEPEKGQSPEPATIYQTLIQPIFDQRCVQCHKAGKAKGKLRMDHFDGLMAGGSEGPAINPGQSSASLIVQRMSLPHDDELHMPPAGKPDVTPAQLALIAWWIDQGASQTKTLAETAPPPELLQQR